MILLILLIPLLKQAIETLTEIVDDAKDYIEKQYNATIYSVLSANATAMGSMADSSDLWYSICNSYSGFF